MIFRSGINIFFQKCLFSKIKEWMNQSMVSIIPKTRKLINILKNSSLLAYLRLLRSHPIWKTDILWILRRVKAELSLLYQIGFIEMIHMVSKTFIPKFNIFNVFLTHYLILLYDAESLHLFIIILPILKNTNIWIILILKLKATLKIWSTAIVILFFFPNINIIYCNILRIFNIWVFKYFILINRFLKFLVAFYLWFC